MARIALDAMGGDKAPAETVAGAIDAAASGAEVVLVGDADTIRPMLDGADIEVVHAAEVVEMGDDPATAIREKKNASINVAARLVSSGQASGMVSAGSTGAALAAAAFIIGRLPTVARPAIGSIFPTGHVLLDAGANLDVKPSHLAQFAVMGSVLAEIYLQRDAPRVGLLNIGEERGKGRLLEKEAFALLEAAPVNFVGNAEGRDLASNAVDVLVTDGFTGNVLLKGSEGIARAVGRIIAQHLAAMPALAGHVEAIHHGMQDAFHTLDPESYGGAHLVGTRGVVVIAHGSSSRRAIANAIRMAADGAEADLVGRIEAGLAP